MNYEEIHYQLEKMKIPHICHFGEANSIGMFDLGAAQTLCTECRILSGEISLADIAMKRVDPMDREAAFSADEKRWKDDQWCRKEGLLPKHAIYQAGEEGKIYMRYSCLLSPRASGPVTDDRKCFSCKGSIDE